MNDLVDLLNDIAGGQTTLIAPLLRDIWDQYVELGLVIHECDFPNIITRISWVRGWLHRDHKFFFMGTNQAGDPVCAAIPRSFIELSEYDRVQYAVDRTNS